MSKKDFSHLNTPTARDQLRQWGANLTGDANRGWDKAFADNGVAQKDGDSSARVSKAAATKFPATKGWVRAFSNLGPRSNSGASR